MGTTLNTREDRRQAEEEEGENNARQHPSSSSDEEIQASTTRPRRQSPEIAAASLKRGLEDLVADMSIREMKRRLEELGANPRRLGICLEKVRTQAGDALAASNQGLNVAPKTPKTHL